MNKKFFGAALTTLFSLAMVAVTANFSNSSVTKTNAFEHTKTGDAQYSASSFNAVEIARDELTVDVQSLTSTPNSKSATLTFNSVRLTGWPASNKNAYLVIDDEDYSGSPSNPSLSGKPTPVTFSGYTIEMANKATFTFSYKDQTSGQNVSKKEYIVPEYLSYGDSFKIKNEKILSGSFVFPSNPVENFENLIIPAGITTIESKAIQNVPGFVKILCEAESKPAGWANDWCYPMVDASQIEWGYTLKGQETTGRPTNNETNQRTQTTNNNNNYYGDLVKAASDANEQIYAIVDDVNWTGDFDHPVRQETQKPYELDSYVCLIEDLDGPTSIHVPETMKYGDDLKLKNKSIQKNALNFVLGENKSYLGTTTEITIPAGIETIESKAIVNVPESVTIKCEAAQKPSDWSDSWTDAKASQIQWGVALTASEKETVVDSTDREFRLGNEATTYVLGYKYTRSDDYYCAEDDVSYKYDELVDGKCPNGHSVTRIEDKTPEMQKPLVICYDVKNTSNNSTRTVWYEMPLLSEEATSSSTSHYDAVRSEPLSRSFDILLEEGEEFVATSVKVYNIFRIKSEKILSKVVEQGQIVEKYITYRYPDTKVCFTASASKRYEKEVGVKEVIDYRFKGLTQFFDYSMISMEIDKVLPSYWMKGMSQEIIDSFKDHLDDGSYSIRYAIYNLSNSFYRLTYYSPTLNQDVTVTTLIRTPNPVVILEKDAGNEVSFLIHNNDIVYENGNKKVADFELKNLKHFEIVGFTINIHLWNNAQSIKVGRTDLSVHFGAVDVMPKASSTPSIYNIFTFVLIFELIFLAVYAVGAVVLFFVLREKFKNDEFRRMKPKQYIKTAILGYVGLLIISITILFIVFRGGMFNNAVSVHNPVDVFIVIPGVISIVVIGYFIKFMVGKIKASKQRKVAQKLKLNEDANDDGTK